jgi:hypothetical protein
VSRYSSKVAFTGTRCFVPETVLGPRADLHRPRIDLGDPGISSESPRTRL